MRTHWLALVVGLGLSSSCALADPFVQVFQYSSYPPSSSNQVGLQPDFDPGEDIVFTVHEDARYIRILPKQGADAYSSDVDIGRVFASIGTITTPREVKIYIGDKFVDAGTNGSGVPGDAIEERWGHYWLGLDVPRESDGDPSTLVKFNLYAAVGNALKGDVTAYKLTRLDLGAELSKNVTIDNGISGATRVQARQMYSTGTTQPQLWIKSGPLVSLTLLGRVPQVGVLSGAMYGTLKVDAGDVASILTGSTISGSPPILNDGTIKGAITVSGKINTIEVLNGVIKGPDATTLISAGTGIGTIIADSIECDIVTNSANPTGTGLGYISSFVTRTEDFKGVLTTRGVGIPSATSATVIDVARDVIGTINIDDAVQSVTGDAAIKIGRHLTSGSTIRIGKSMAGSSSNGGVAFADNAGLKGQIIVNADDDSSTWTGHVDVGTAADLATSYYAEPSSLVGGGAVGLVPYHLYDADCDPPHHDDWIVPSGETHVLNSHFNGAVTPAASVRMRFYGPVKTNAASGTPPVAVWLWIADDTGQIQQWKDVTSAFNVGVNRANATSRELVLTKSASYGNLPPGYYAVTVISSGGDRLYCDGTNAPTPPGVAPSTLDAYDEPITQYNFVLFSDCDANGVWDATDIAGDAGLDTNLDGYLDSCVPTGTLCPIDLDDGLGGGVPDGAVDVNDLIFFLIGFESGSVIVDVDDGNGAGVHDSATDINDLLFFLTHFEAGC